MKEFTFKVKGSKKPFFLRAENYEDAQSQIEMIGYEIDTEIETAPEAKESITQESIIQESITKKHEVAQTECDSCSTEQFETNKAGNKVSLLKELPYFGRVLRLCDTCYAKEKVVAEKKLDTKYGANFQDKIERIVADKVNKSEFRWSEIYNAERPAWVLANFTSIEEMRDKLVQFIVDLEDLDFKTKTKIRIGYDVAREFEAKLSREQREALVTDPNFQIPDNSEYRVRMSKEDKMIAKLKGMGMTDKAIDEFLKSGE